MSTHDLSRHRLFALLPSALALAVTRALVQLHAEWLYDGPLDMYDHLREQVQDRALLPDLTEADRDSLQQWLVQAPAHELVALLARTFWPRRPAAVPRPATDGQLRIIEEAQAEVGVDLRAYFPRLTAWEADLLIKGILVVSEVLRCTGDCRFQPRDLRAAIRLYLTADPAGAAAQQQ